MNAVSRLLNRNFIFLFLGQIFSHFADAIVQFLLVAVLLSMSGSAGKSIATMFFIFLLPQFLLSPFTGALCDRISRKAILSISCFYRAITVCAIVLFLPRLSLNLIYTFAFIYYSNSLQVIEYWYNLLNLFVKNIR